MTVPLGPDVSLSCSTVETVATTPGASVSLTDEARAAMEASLEALDTLQDRNAPIYGVTTGFGPLVDRDAAPASTHAEGLLAHLSAGAGEFIAPPLARAMIAVRLHALAQSQSGIRPRVAEAMAELLAHNLTPAVPSVGSVGASGDLTPMAHAARARTGDGQIQTADGLRSAADALADAGLSPLDLARRDALALVNGTALMTGAAALAIARADRLARRAEQLTGWAYRLLGCSLDPLDPRLHDARGHPGQIDSAAAIRDEATRGGPQERGDRPLQEVYSLRSAPQVLGAARDQLTYVRGTVTTELNGVTDNPLITADPPAALHGANFQGQQVAFAADALNAALTQIGVLAERQLDVLLTPDRNGGAPPLLAWTPGATSGLAGAQLTATALVAEMRQDAQMTATSSIPTNGGNQDIVSMGALAARTAYAQTDRVASILAVLGMALAQLTHLRAEGRADGPAPAPPPWMPAFAPVVEDRALREEIADLASAWLAPE